MEPAMGLCSNQISGRLLAVLADDLGGLCHCFVKLTLCQMKPGCLEQPFNLGSGRADRRPLFRRMISNVPLGI
jgi:hypothetical protein